VGDPTSERARRSYKVNHSIECSGLAVRLTFIRHAFEIVMISNRTTSRSATRFPQSGKLVLRVRIGPGRIGASTQRLPARLPATSAAWRQCAYSYITARSASCAPSVCSGPRKCNPYRGYTLTSHLLKSSTAGRTAKDGEGRRTRNNPYQTISPRLTSARLRAQVDRSTRCDRRMDAAFPSRFL
jgi:hypothetical protein